MEKTPDRSRRLPFEKTESGMLAGVWHVATDGYEWREDLRPLIRNGKVQFEDPGDTAVWLVPRGHEARRYPFLRRLSLLRDFHRLALEPSPAAILGFAERYGSLGPGELLVSRTPREDGEGRLIIADDSSPFGESLSEWRKETRDFRNLWETWQAVRTISNRDSVPASQVSLARRALRDQIEWPPGGPISFLYPLVPGAPIRGFTVIAHPADEPAYTEITSNLPSGDFVAAAKFHVHTEINKRLRGHVNPYVLPFMGGKLRFFPDSLRAAIYMRFAFELSEGIGRVRQCSGCAQPFEPARRDQQFCGKNCRERAGYRRRLLGVSSERDRNSR